MNAFVNTSKHKQIAQIYTAINSGKASMILPVLNTLQKQYQDDAVLYHLSALAYWQCRKSSIAVDDFKRSIQLDHRQHEVHNNLANLYRELGQYDLAKKHYQTAVGLKPTFFDAWKNLGLLWMERGEYADSLEALLRADQLAPKSCSIMTALGNVHRQMGDFTEAVSCYESALALDDQYLNAIYNLGLTMFLQGDYSAAIKFYRRARKLAPRHSELDANEASAHVASGDLVAAERYFLSAIEKKPDNIEAHKYLNELLWQQGKHEHFCLSYDSALEMLPGSVDLYFSKAQMQIIAGQYELAQRTIEIADLECGNPGFDILRARIYSKNGDETLAINAYRSSLSKRFSLESCQEYTILLIKNRDYMQAQEQLDICFKHSRHDQLSWALQALIWRAAKDDRYHFLCNYKDFVSVYTLPVPQGYSSLQCFLDEIISLVLAKHKTCHEPLMQTVKNGTQTPGRLFNDASGKMHLLCTSLRLLVEEYISLLPSDSSHPFLSRKSKRFKFSGSWSVKLGPGGYHVSHVHPQGWISSSFYLRLPSTISDDTSKSNSGGCIQFGQSPYCLGEQDVAKRLIRPEVGQLVLFPSYFWHGTLPFEGEDSDFRLTTPFDVQPV